jgi:sortase (surface protein transpeptidase)
MRRTALTGLVAGLALVVAAVLLWPAGAVGASSAPAAPVPVAAPPLPAPSPAAPSPAAAGGATPPEASPVRVRIGDVSAPVVAVGVDEEGAMSVPEDVRTVGWYRYGPGPGAPSGSSVLSGHVDDQVQGPGAFADLGDLRGDDPVEVELADGAVLRFQVRSVERFAKEELPVDRLFDRSGPSRLVLVTCGGEFDRAARSYQQNVVVTAERAR